MVNRAFVYGGLPPPGLLCLGYGAAAAGLVARGRRWGLVFAWPCLLYAVISYAYLRDGTFGAWLLGKRQDTGRIPLLRVLAFLPFLWTCWLVWWLRHVLLLSNEDGYNLVAPGLYLGRYPLWLPRCQAASSFPFHRGRGVAVVDLCAEFPALPWIVGQAEGKYVCLPCLDGDMPEDRWALLRAARMVAGWAGSQQVYVHCANGRGRSLCFVALVLVLRGDGPRTAEEAIASIRKSRPQVRAQPAQVEIVAEALRLHERGDIELSESIGRRGSAERADEAGGAARGAAEGWEVQTPEAREVAGRRTLSL